jgi:hypothetical protein
MEQIPLEDSQENPHLQKKPKIQYCVHKSPPLVLVMINEHNISANLFKDINWANN